MQFPVCGAAYVCCHCEGGFAASEIEGRLLAQPPGFYMLVLFVCSVINLMVLFVVSFWKR